MLPFLKNKQEAGAASSSEPVMRKSDTDEFDSLEVAASDLLAAIQAKDAKAMASAMRAAFELMESEPHEESNE